MSPVTSAVSNAASSANSNVGLIAIAPVTIVEVARVRVVAEAICTKASDRVQPVPEPFRGLFHLPVVLGGEGARQTPDLELHHGPSNRFTRTGRRRRTDRRRRDRRGRRGVYRRRRDLLQRRRRRWDERAYFVGVASEQWRRLSWCTVVVVPSEVVVAAPSWAASPRRSSRVAAVGRRSRRKSADVAHDADDAEEGHADDGLYSPDDAPVTTTTVCSSTPSGRVICY